MIALILDTETSGLLDNHTLPLAKQPEVIELCALKINLETGEQLAEFDSLIKPHTPVSAEITKITGITNEQLEPWLPFAARANAIQELIEDSPTVIAHNLSYDSEMLDLEFERLGRKIAWPRKLCTVEATVHLTGFRLTLTALHEHLFGVGFPAAHRARTDTEALVRCCVELFKRGEI